MNEIRNNAMQNKLGNNVQRSRVALGPSTLARAPHAQYLQLLIYASGGHHVDLCLVDRASAISPPEGISKEALHGGVMEKDATEHSKMPDIVTATNVVEASWKKTFWDFGGVHTCASNVYQ